MMKPSRELDFLIAEKVMGLDLEKYMTMPPKPTGAYAKSRNPFVIEEVPHYSTDIAAAWQVVEKVGPKIIKNECEYVFVIRFYEHGFGERGPIGRHWEVGWFQFDYDQVDSIEAKSECVPFAICLAALKAVGVEISE
jgi:hypothetical protein